MSVETHEIEFPTAEPDIVSSDVHSIYLPISKELAESLTVGDRIHVRASGIVKEVSAGYMDSDDYNLRLSIKRVEVDTENEFEVLSRDDD